MVVQAFNPSTQTSLVYIGIKRGSWRLWAASRKSVFGGEGPGSMLAKLKL